MRGQVFGGGPTEETGATSTAEQVVNPFQQIVSPQVPKHQATTVEKSEIKENFVVIKPVLLEIGQFRVRLNLNQVKGFAVARDKVNPANSYVFAQSDVSVLELFRGPESECDKFLDGLMEKISPYILQVKI